MSALDLKEKESISQIFTAESLAKQDTWFPTLQKTYWVLSQLRPYVKVSIYNTLLNVFPDNNVLACNLRGHLSRGPLALSAVLGFSIRDNQDEESTHD